MISKDSHVMITGGTGSFGYQMTKKLLEKYSNIKITVYSRDEDKHREMNRYFNDNRISYVIGDLRDYNRLEEAMKNIDIVLHAGALKQIPYVEFNPMEAIKTNTLSAYSVMKASDRNNVKQVIAISTDKACKPINSYGMTKALMEKIFIGDDIKSKTQFCCVRYGNVLGSRGSVLPVWDRLIQENKPIPITSFKMRRFFLTLDQAAELILFASKNSWGKDIFVSKAPALYVKDLAHAYTSITTGHDYPQTEIGVRAGEKIDEVLVSAEEMAHTEDLGDYYKINRPDDFAKILPSNEFSSATTRLLTISQIKNLLKNLKWIK